MILLPEYHAFARIEVFFSFMNRGNDIIIIVCSSCSMIVSKHIQLYNDSLAIFVQRVTVYSVIK